MPIQLLSELQLAHLAHARASSGPSDSGDGASSRDDGGGGAEGLDVPLLRPPSLLPSLLRRKPSLLCARVCVRVRVALRRGLAAAGAAGALGRTTAGWARAAVERLRGARLVDAVLGVVLATRARRAPGDLECAYRPLDGTPAPASAASASAASAFATTDVVSAATWFPPTSDAELREVSAHVSIARLERIVVRGARAVA